MGVTGGREMRNNQLQPLQRNTLARDAAGALRDAIISGQIGQGTRLVEEDLAQRLGVSRGPIRDALRELSLEGLIEYTPSGVFVIGLDEGSVRQLHDYRALLEEFSVKQAILTASEDDLEKLWQIHAKMADGTLTKGPDPFAAVDMEFHRWIVIHSRNRLVSQSWESISQTIAASLRITDRQSRTSAVLAYHSAILEAIQRKDMEAAVEALRNHLGEAYEILIRARTSSRWV